MKIFLANTLTLYSLCLLMVESMCLNCFLAGMFETAGCCLHMYVRCGVGLTEREREFYLMKEERLSSLVEG